MLNCPCAMSSVSNGIFFQTCKGRIKKKEVKTFGLVLVDVRENDQIINWSLTKVKVLLGCCRN